jgi:hypothetical protein
MTGGYDMPRGRPRKSDQVLMKSAEFIGWALGGLEREITQTRQRLAALTEQAARLRQRVGSTASRTASDASTAETGAGQTRKRRRRRMSPEARKRISEMMKKRWAERRRKNA